MYNVPFLFSEALNALYDDSLPTGYDFSIAPTCNCPKNCEQIEYTPELSLAHYNMSKNTNVSELEGVERYGQLEKALNMPEGSLSGKMLEAASVLNVYYKSIGIVHYKRDEVYSIADFAGKSFRMGTEGLHFQIYQIQVPSEASSASAWASAS